MVHCVYTTQASLDKLEKRLSTKDALTGQESEKDNISVVGVTETGHPQNGMEHQEQLEGGMERERETGHKGTVWEPQYSGDEDSDHDLQIYMV